MECFDMYDFFEPPTTRKRGGRSKGPKRKWREIEMLNDRRQLQKELRELGIETELKDIEI